MAPRKTGLDAEIRDLYRGPLDEFTPARNALAARLKKEKRTDDAAEVKSLPKPTPSAWGVNLLFEREPEKMKELLAAGKRARTAQREAVSGRGLESLRETIRDARRLADELRWDAAHVLSEQGRGAPSRTIVERIAANLQALAFSPSAAEEASRGWLDRDLDPPGFEVLAGLTAGAPVVDLEARRKEREEKKKEPEPARPKADRDVRDVREARKEEEERRKREAAEEARREREAERVRRRVAVAEEKVERARAEADPLREEAEQAEAAVAEARRRLEEAERAAARIRPRYERAAERLAHAEAALREAREEA